jgi:hypothetical protein
MSSGSIQLSVVGLQDEYLTGSPDVTYFIKRFNRHTKFALETLNVPFNQTNIDFGSWVNVVIPRNGQLIRNIYVKFTLPALTFGGYTDGIGNAIIQYADLVIGGQVIERINGEYMQIYDQTFISDSQQVALTYMSGTTSNLYGLGSATAYSPGVQQPAYGFYPRTFIVALPFYFIRNEALSIPLCALTRSEVEVRIQFQPLDNLIAGGYVQSNVVAVSSVNWTFPPNYSQGPQSTTIIGTSTYGDSLSDVTWLPASQLFACVAVNSKSNVYYYDYNSTHFDYFSSGIGSIAFSNVITGIAQSSSGATLVVSLGNPGPDSMKKAAIALNGPTSTFTAVDDPVDSQFSIRYFGVASDGTNFLAIGSGLFGAFTRYNSVISFSSPSFVATTVSGLYLTVNLVTVSWSPGLNAYVIGDSTGNMYTYTIGSSSLIQIPGVVGPYTAWSSTYGQIYNVTQVACSNDVISNVSEYSINGGVSWINIGLTYTSNSISYSPSLNQFFTIGYNAQEYSIGIPQYTGVVQYPTEVGTDQFQASMPVEYVFLADEEVSYIQGAKIDYVITQLQQAATVIPAGATTLNGYKLYFVNPVKELFFIIQDSNVLAINDYWNYQNTSTGGDQLVNLQLQFNGEDIISPTVADALYLGTVQFYNNHTRVPDTYFYNYSFSIDPENYLPTGQVNMSRIMNQNIWLNLTANPNSRNVRIYAKSYNILRIQNGLGGVLFIDNVTSIPGN